MELATDYDEVFPGQVVCKRPHGFDYGLTLGKSCPECGAVV